jgi:putative glutamine amidotransferase
MAEAQALRSSSRSTKPIVGVTASLDRQRLRPGSDYWYLNRNYSRALARAGAAVVLLCPDMSVEDCLEHCEGVVLSGGGDLPARFAAGWQQGDWSAHVPGEPEALERIGWERELLAASADRGTPVLGVCFGMQLMNLQFGGSLLTDLSGREPAALDHGGGGRSAPHALRVAPDSPFFGNWSPPPLVSSSHRQAIAEVAPGFRASAWAQDGVVEAIERGPLLGVEWHPEGDASGNFVYGRWVQLLLERR